MREIVVDTETTGLDPDDGHRIVEIGCVELFNHLPTGATFHTYLNPERDMPVDAFRVHNLSSEFLSDKPLFSAKVEEFQAFIGTAPLIIHNAQFDIKFLNAELKRVQGAILEMERAVDTLMIARRRYPGAGASLDSLCKRFGIDLTARARDGHGALIDAGLLAQVYLELVGGREPVLVFAANAANDEGRQRVPLPPRPVPLAPRVTEEEMAAHLAFLRTLPGGAVWLREA